MTAPDTTRQAEAVKPDTFAIGAQLANVAFNWAQQPGYTLTSDDCAMLDNLRKKWDESRRAAVPVQDMLDELRKELAEKQEKIDALMLEYCPDEMTVEQTDEWARHQKPAFMSPKESTNEK